MELFNKILGLLLSLIFIVPESLKKSLRMELFNRIFFLGESSSWKRSFNLAKCPRKFTFKRTTRIRRDGNNRENYVSTGEQGAGGAGGPWKPN